MNDPFTLVADGVYQVQLPLPFALRIVNCYLLRDGAGWTIVDTGIHTPDGEAAWQAAFAALNIRPRAIQRILMTHVHPDHFGMAGWLQAEIRADGGDAAVYTSPREIEQARLIWEKATDVAFADYLHRHGMPYDMAQAVDAGLEDTTRMTLPHADRLHPLLPDTDLTIGARTFRVLDAPGHADGQIIFFDAAEGLLLSGDHVMMKITPNIGIWPETDPHPLRRYLASLTTLRALPVRLALPGHKALITDWQGRINELLAHHEERLEQTLLAVRAGNHDAYAVALVIFRHAGFTSHEWRFALAEALAHLDELALRGQISQTGTRFLP